MTKSASELVDAALEGVRVWQEGTNAFGQVFAEQARAQAEAVERTGSLAGVPIAVKELFDVRGYPTTGCCAAVRPEPAERDAPLVARLRDEGAIVIGKTNQHELAAGVTNLESSCGPTLNPWDPARISGGSSGGSAIAVATGSVRIALGSDTGGSARIPASFCGTWGLKPTTGRLPTDGMMPLAREMDCPGLLAGSLEDLRLAWDVVGGRPSADAAPSRIGVLRGGRWDRCHPEIREAIERAAERCRDHGVRVLDVDGSALDDVHHVWNRIAWPSFAETYPDLIGNPDLTSTTASLLAWGADHRDTYADARARAERIRGWFDDTFRDADLLLTATTPYVAPAIDTHGVDLGDGTTMDVHRGGPSWFTTAANVAGLPALSVPFTISAEGLPIGVQLMGHRDGEGMLFDGAASLRPSGTELPRPVVPRGR